MSSFDLGAYLDRFPEVCKVKYEGTTYNFQPLVASFEHLSRGQSLAAKHIQNIFERRSTPFAKYWPEPDYKTLDKELRRRQIKLSPLQTENRARLIETLLEVIKNLPTVTLILRFTYPSQFGVFSSPILNLLQVNRVTGVEAYLACCDELREWMRRFHLPTVAETDTALWTFHEIVKLGLPGADDAQRQFKEDTWIQRQRIGQALKPFLAGESKYLEFAEVLVRHASTTAALIAGREYLRILNSAAKWFREPTGRQNKGWEKRVIDRLTRQNPEIDSGELRKIYDNRCRVSHFEDEVDPVEAETMIEQIKRFRNQVNIVVRTARPH